MYEGDSPLRLKPANSNAVPAITRHDVTDVRASFVADPFMIKVGEIWYLFMEILNMDTGLGEIGMASSSDALTWTYQQVVLKVDFHLSYPFVFEHEGEYYMLPETLSANAIQLYKAINFPCDWKPVAELASGQYSDPTLFQFENRWWMFAGSNPYGHETLNLFCAEQLNGPYIEHPQSPVIQKNIRHARPAGRLIQFEDKLIRLAQDCYPHYGSKVRAFEITQLTTKTYNEKQLLESPLLEAAALPNQWNSGGMHHIDAHEIANNQWIACVDGRFHNKPIVSKRAVWIFDDHYKVPTFLSVASFRAQLNVPITLIYEGTPEQSLVDAFSGIGHSIEIIVSTPNATADATTADRHRHNRLKRMEMMRKWPDEQVLLLDGDLIFSEKIVELIEEIDAHFNNFTSDQSLVWGVTEYDRKFYLEKRDQYGERPIVTEPQLQQSLQKIYGPTWEKRLSGLQYNNGMLLVHHCADLADAWERNYLSGLNYPEVNPEDDQLPLSVAMFDHNTQVRELDKAFNSKGWLTGDYAIYHAWNGNWKAAVQSAQADDMDLNEYARIAQRHLSQMPQLWLHEEPATAASNR